MIVAGGCYRELCELPYWDQTLGSGGRAAAVIASYSNDVRLRTYFRPSRHLDLYTLEAHGVAVEATPRDQDITFAYLHPLSAPYRLPRRIVRCDDIRVEGRSVLRFGFVEGDAIVNAAQAVYDPQSAAPVLFNSNGSRAERLVIILNQSELYELSKSQDLREAARRLLQVDRAEAVIVKCGAKGAWVCVAEADPHFVPAFRSKRVFKIGTGDVFSGVFAYNWCEKGVDALQAAITASKAVSFYAETRCLKIAADQREAAQPTNIRISVVSSGVTLADRWLREEARSALMSLGAELVELPSNSLNPDAKIDSILVLADGDPQSSFNFIKKARLARVPTVVFRERGNLPSSKSAEVFYSDDFSTAIYHTFWVSSYSGTSFSTTKPKH